MKAEDADANNLKTEKKYQKTAKVGEGTYAVVYRGKKTFSTKIVIDAQAFLSGTQLATSRLVAIKKIKMGQFKDGLDWTAIREVKYLQELKHPNIIEVSHHYPIVSHHAYLIPCS